MEFLGKIPVFLKLCRPSNVVIAGLTQWGVHHYILKPFLPGIILKGHLLFLFIVCLLFLTSGGFVINDIQDLTSDKINKPFRPLSSAMISIRSAYIFYSVLLLSGAITAFYVASKVGHPALVLLYVFWAFALYAYSKWWKATILVGNVAVSLFVASVPAMMLFAEREAFQSLQDGVLKSKISELLLMMVLLSFLINLIREIAKDVEDQVGDNIAGYITFVTKYGERTTSRVMLWLTIMTAVISICWILFTSIPMSLQHITMLILFVIAPLGVATQIFTASTHKRKTEDASALLRWVMLAGVISCLMISKSISSGNAYNLPL